MYASVAYGLIKLGWLNGVLLVSMFTSACSAPFVCLCHSEFSYFTFHKCTCTYVGYGCALSSVYNVHMCNIYLICYE